MSEHQHVGGSVGGPGEWGVECACGVAFDGFDTMAEAREQLDRHIYDATVSAELVGLMAERDELRGELEVLRSRGIVLPEVAADRIVETVLGAINVGDSVRRAVIDLLRCYQPPGEWREGDIVLDRTDFVWRRFESGWRTYPRDRGVQYGDTWLVEGLGPLVRLDRVPDEVDRRIGAVPREVAASLRQVGAS